MSSAARSVSIAAPEKIYDVIGVGFGPANIALAIAIEELGSGLNSLFLEARDGPSWQPGMLFEGADIQNHPLRDLVTPRNPRSRYTFTNFLFENGRLFEHLNLHLMFPMRVEYAQYIAWVARHFDRWVRYGVRVEHIEVAGPGRHSGGAYRVATTSGQSYQAKALVLAPGRTPYMPKIFQAAACDRITHLVDYLETLKLLRGGGLERVAVVGGSQSAVEIILHLTRFLPEAEIVGLNPHFGYRLKDTSPFTGEVYFPEFVDLFYNADQKTKNRLRRDLHFTNYSSTDGDVLDELYRYIYHEKLVGRQRVQVLRCADILRVDDLGKRVRLSFVRPEGGGVETAEVDLVVLGTGFRDVGTAENQERFPPIFQPLEPFARLREDGCIQINYDYSVEMADEIEPSMPCFVNGLCESSHGMGDAGSFSLLSLRAKTILDSLTSRLRARSRAKVSTNIAGCHAREFLMTEKGER